MTPELLGRTVTKQFQELCLKWSGHQMSLNTSGWH